MEMKPDDQRAQHGRVLNAKWDGRDTFTVEEVGGILGLSRGAAYDAVKSGTIGAVKIGRRLVIPRLAIERLLS